MPTSAICEVWSATTDQLRPAHRALLSAAELERAGRFRRREDENRSLLAAALVRLLGLRLRDGGTDPERARELDVRRTCVTCGGPHGKPAVGGGVHLSVSHAGALVVVAATRVAAVGIDVEPLGHADRARRALAATCPPDELADARGALRCWTRREALLKATGEGLAVPPANVRMSAPDEPARLLGWTGRPTPACTLLDLDRELPAGFVGTLAVLAAGPVRLVLHPADLLLAA